MAKLASNNQHYYVIKLGGLYVGGIWKRDKSFMTCRHKQTALQFTSLDKAKKAACLVREINDDPKKAVSLVEIMLREVMF